MSITTADTAAITAVARDYYDAWFTGNADKMHQVLHPSLAKRAPYNDGLDEDTAATMVAMTEEARGSKWEAGMRHLDVEIAHLHGDIASVITTGPIYVEYLHLVRLDGRWQIVNALYARS